MAMLYAAMKLMYAVKVMVIMMVIKYAGSDDGDGVVWGDVADVCYNGDDDDDNDVDLVCRI